MEVVVPSVQEFHFDSGCTPPYMSAPSSPNPFGDPFDHLYHFTSAPSSPTRAAAIYAQLSNSSTFPPTDAVYSEQKLAAPTSNAAYNDNDDFAFDSSGQLERGGRPPPALTTADELFDKGKIRPLMQPPRLQLPLQDDRRGRERSVPPPSMSSSRSRRGARSLSPLRGGGRLPPLQSPPASSLTTTIASVLKVGGGKKWRLRDLLLFRSASEGRATGRGSKDPLRRYSLLPSSSSSSLLPASWNKRRSGGENSKDSSFGSAHEKHYTANRAATEELKKKTALPYSRHGIFGCLRFNPAINTISRSFNSYSFNQRRS